MITNYLKVILRLVSRQRTFAFINVFGLTMGLYGFILIFLFVRYEVNFDKHHKNLDRLYQVVRDSYFGEDVYQLQPLPYAFRDAIINEYPEIEKAVRYDPWSQFIIKYDQKVSEERVLLADKEIFDMFTFNILEGNQSEPVKDKYSVAISRRIATKFFPGEMAVGKTIQVSNKYEFTITAVYENWPSNSSFNYDIIIPFQFLENLGADLNQWGNNVCLTFILVKENTDITVLDEKLRPRLAQQQAAEVPDDLFLHPYKDLHLYKYHYAPGGLIQSVYIFTAIGLIILFLAGINYVNLVTARSVRRTKEIGIRKSVGATRTQVIVQFLGESVLFAVLALNFAVLLAELTLPLINSVIGKTLDIEYGNPSFVLTLLGFAVITGILAGLYPAFYLSRFSPVSVLKNHGKTGGKAFKSFLIVTQFATSIALIITSVLLYRQFQYMINLPVGLDKENIFYFQLEEETINHFETIKQEFSNLPHVNSVSFSSRLPIQIGSNGGGFEWDGKPAGQDVLVSFLELEPDYLKTFQIPLVEGRFFEYNEQTYDTVHLIYKVVINQKFREIMGLETAVGKSFRNGNWGYSFEIIGVTGDFNFTGMYRETEPLIMFYAGNNWNYGFVKFEGSPLEIKENLDKKYSEMFPSYPANFRLLNDRYEANFTSISRNAGIYGYFTILAIIISCLGLYGLSSFMAEQRRKEMGIRKAMGASTVGLTTLMLAGVAKWILLANVIAIPAAWYYSDYLLSKFTFHTDVSVWVILFAILISIIVSGITVFFQIFRAANQNPATVLKYE